jgi:L-ascorbate metabolism protein UlaG (beta-lactamase superfamily)
MLEKNVERTERTMATIEWLGHASFRITGEGMTIYIDPWKLKNSTTKANLILVSHSHYDHLSVEDIEKISAPGVQIVCSRDCAPKLPANAVKAVGPGETVKSGAAMIRTVRAYNPDKQFHPKQNDWLGFLIDLGGETIYYAGDTDVIPEMSSLGKVDVALLPVGGAYTMTAAEAAEAIRMIKPCRAVPYHWGDIVGSGDDAREFKRRSSVPVEVLQPGQIVAVS